MNTGTDMPRGPRILNGNGWNMVRADLSSGGVYPKKRLGQNFIIDPDVCPAIAKIAANDCPFILEVGPGTGALTVELAGCAEKVIAVEVDQSLKPVLERAVSGYGNVDIIYGDFMRLDLKELVRVRFGGAPYAVAANIPYYITTPVVMKFIESETPPVSVTVTVQEEAAERFVAPVPSRKAGAVTVAIAYKAEASYLFAVSKECFYPRPNVESAVIKLNMRDKPAVNVQNESEMFRLVKAGFGQRRKTFANAAAASGFRKDIVLSALCDAGIDRNIRAEALSLAEWAFIADKICEREQQHEC